MTERAVILADILRDQLRSGAPRETLLWTLGMIRSEVMSGDVPGAGQAGGVAAAAAPLSVDADAGASNPVSVQPALSVSDGLDVAPGGAPRPVEVNQALGAAAASLNDALREGRREVGEVLVPEGVTELRQAIGLNDRFRLIEGLFGGDAAAFDETVRALDGRGGLAAAEALLSEVGVRRGWRPDDALAGLLRQLLRRRFAAM
jgi:hypothetical protein